MADSLLLLFILLVSNPFGLGIPAMKDRDTHTHSHIHGVSVDNCAMYESQYITITLRSFSAVPCSHVSEALLVQ